LGIKLLFLGALIYASLKNDNFFEKFFEKYCNFLLHE